MNSVTLASALVGLAVASSAHASIRITEWMYDGTNGEFVELTNLGSAPIDVSGWRLVDDRRALSPVVELNGPGTRRTTTSPFSLSSLGSILPGESIIVTERSAADFASLWSLPSSIRVLGGLGSSQDVGGSGTVSDPTIRLTNGFNFGRNDEINVVDGLDQFVDVLRYGDSEFVPGSIRTQRRSGVAASLAAVGANNAALWNFANVVPQGGPFDLTGVYGTSNGFRSSVGGDIGNPGFFIPSAGSLALVGLAGMTLARRRR